MIDPKEECVLRAYALVGRAATQFSALEFHFQFLISALITGKLLALEAVIVTRRSSFGERIQLLRELATSRFSKDDPLRKRAVALANDLDALRDERNLFIHGFWLINWPLIAADQLIRCSDPKWRFDRKTEEWKSMESRDVRLSELEELIKRTISATDEVHGVLQALESRACIPEPQAGSPTNHVPATPPPSNQQTGS